jgi:two-component system, OmpR family, phosphate regulon sensor histidine kinase PhoR
MGVRIRWRLVWPFLILLVLAVISLTALSLRTVRQEEQVLWQDLLLDYARLIASEASSEGRGETAQLDRIVNRYADNLGFTIAVIGLDGERLGSSSSEILNLTFALESVDLILSEGQAAWITGETSTVAVPLMVQASRPVGLVILQAPQASLRMELTTVWRLAGLVTLVSLLVGALLALIIDDQTRKPIESLTIISQQISTGNFHNLAFPDAPQELAELNQSLKEMAQHLGEQIDALTSERAKLSAVLDQMTDGVLIADFEGRVQLLNPAAERLFQIDEADGLGRSVVEVLRYHQLVDLWRMARVGERQITMLEIGPQHLFLQVTGMPLKTSEKGSTLILFQDLTQLRRLETVRRDFISNVSHELRTPLASLKALGETLQEGALDDPPAARRFIIRMETEIDNLTQLVNELLELSRIESGKVPLSFHRIQPLDLLKTAYERMELQVERAGLNLVLDCPPELPVVFADPDRITQVLINLIHNATKFTPPGGVITLSAYRDGDFVVLFVKDTGIGIPKKDLGRIFERFYKADRARTAGGTGLGLSIARHMVESHGGFIWAESEEDLGSAFYFSLPIA